MSQIQISDALLELAVRAATEGGEYAQSAINSAERERKADDSFVTEADKQIDRNLRELLESETNHHVLSEEHGQDELLDGSYWVVDPIDGTQNYAYQQPNYGTTVAFVEDGQPTRGCFYMPEFDYTFYAMTGKGAYLNDTPLTVSEKQTTENAYLLSSGKRSSTNHAALASIDRWVQRLSCALQSEAYVSAGWVDAGVFGLMNPWDFAAGTVLVREAGGVVTRLDTGESTWEAIANGGVVMANPELASAIIDALPQESIDNLTPHE